MTNSSKVQLANDYLSTSILTMINIILSLLAEGYAVVFLWEWFVIPVFNLPSLNIALAFGFIIFGKLVTGRKFETNSPSVEGKTYDTLWKALLIETAQATARPVLALVFGWIIHLFV